MKEKLVALGLNEEQVNGVLEQMKGFIPIDRFNEVNERKKAAETAVAERDKQLNELKKSVGDNDDLKKQIETLQNENKVTKEKLENELKQVRIDAAIEAALTAAGAKNTKMGRALVDFSKITVEEDGIKGIDEQIKEFVTRDDCKFLFETQVVKGTKPADGSGNPQPNKPIEQMTYSERIAMLNNN